MFNPKYSQDLTGLCTCDVEDLDYQGGSFTEIGGHIGGKRRLPKPTQIRTPGHKARSPSVYIVSVFINTQHGSVIRAGFCSMHMLMHMQKLSSEVVLTFVKVIAVGSS